MLRQPEFARRDQFGNQHYSSIVKYFQMRNFRQFEAGPDPFGRKFQVYFKWLQTAISLRHADTVDVKFVLEDEDGARTAKDHRAAAPRSAGGEPGNRPQNGRPLVLPPGRACT